MMRKSRKVAMRCHAIPAILLLAGAFWNPAAADGLAPTVCWFTAPKQFAVSCYRLKVPESRAGNGGIELSLPVVIISSPRDRRHDDPVVYLAGGPGDGAWLDPERIGWWWDFIDANAWLRTRDLVLVDQRGTGLTIPRMDCPELQAAYIAELALGRDYATGAKLERAAVSNCHKRVLAEGHDPTSYTTSESATDLHDLFNALGRPKWNVYGLSYGTRLALTYMRDFPDDIRSVILDSVVPLQAHFFEDSAWVADRAFGTLFAGCAEDDDCRRNYPRLQADLETLVAELNAQPLSVIREHPLESGSLAIQVTGDLLLNHLFANLYRLDDIEYVPNLIEAFKARYMKKIETEMDYLIENWLGREDYGEGLMISANCLEEAPFNDSELGRAAYRAYPMLQGWASVPILIDACDQWAKKPADPLDGAAVSSDLPSLVLAGAYDPVTPPQYARMAAASLRRGFLFEFPGIGHDALAYEPCAALLAERFLDDPGIMPRHDCLGDLATPDFKSPWE
jgi:pimeloyl-ACP methyl ester carboxylesterase